MTRTRRFPVPAVVLSAALLRLTPLPAPAPARVAVSRVSLLAFTATASAGLGYDRIGLRRGDRFSLRDDLEPGVSMRYSDALAGDVAVAGHLDGSGDDAASLWRDGL